ncbi:MAG: hypothetical protein FJ138_06175 [Deltaproteobacteria bacterium]|nr:hypothetical protein [Deltaproteobacteria bacterium]
MTQETPHTHFPRPRAHARALTPVRALTPALALAPILALAPAALLSCDDEAEEGTGVVRFVLQAEDLVTRGIAAGEGSADIRDGWAARFDSYRVALTGVELRSGAEARRAPESYMVDLTRVPESGFPGWSLAGVPARRWDVWYETPLASEVPAEELAAALPDGDLTSAADEQAAATRMRSEGLSYLIAGALSAAGGASCPPRDLATPPPGATPTRQNERGDDCFAAAEVRFELAVGAEALYGPCELDGVPGVAVPSGGEVTVALTLHVDHMFFNGFPEGSEAGVQRLAQWLADCDLDLDGVVTMEELGRVAPAQVLDDRFQLGGAPVSQLATMADYMRAQLMTQGHYQGEGECAVNGVAHEHEGEHADEP